MMSMFDPSSNSNATLLENILYWFSIIIFFIIDGHHMLIRTLIESFNVIKLGKFILSQRFHNGIIKAFIQFFAIGLKIAIPIVLIIIITDITMGLIARTVPQLNVMILGMPIKILIGLTTFSFILTIFLKIIISYFQQFIQKYLREFYKVIPIFIIFASDDKTEEATPKKKSEARKKGQVAKK